MKLWASYTVFLVLFFFGAGCANTTQILKEIGTTVAIFETASFISTLNHELGHWSAQENDDWIKNPRIEIALGKGFHDYPREFLRYPVSTGFNFMVDASNGFFSGRFHNHISNDEWNANYKKLLPKAQHLVLGGVLANENEFHRLNTALREGKLSGRFAHARAFSSALDLPMYALRDGAGGYGDLAQYTRYVSGKRSSLIAVGCVDLIGKLPDLVWHWNGMRGRTGSPPTLWRVGRCGIRPSAVTIETHARVWCHNKPNVVAPNQIAT